MAYDRKAKKLKFAFIGCGKMASFHADVVKHLGHTIEVVVAREGSLNIDNFAKKYSIPEKLYGIDSFIKYYDDNNKEINCVLICAAWDKNEAILEQLLPLGLPVMVEKPAVLSMGALNRMKRKYDMKDVFVAYNRKFYDFTLFVKNIMDRQHPVCVDILSSEPFGSIIKDHGRKIGHCMPHFYTSHIIDLMFYLTGDAGIKDIWVDKKNNRIYSLISSNGGYPIQFKILMDCPQNSYMKIFFEKKVIEMQPFEKMVLYDKLETGEINGRRHYFPRAQKEIITDDRFKPGLLKQMEYFINNFVYKKNYSGKHIERLAKVTSLCDTLVKSRRK